MKIYCEQSTVPTPKEAFSTASATVEVNVNMSYFYFTRNVGEDSWSLGFQYPSRIGVETLVSGPGVKVQSVTQEKNIGYWFI